MSVQAPLPHQQSPVPDHPPVETGYKALLKNRDFLMLWLGQVFSQLADRVVFVVFIALVLQQFGPSDRYNSFLYIAFTIPAIALTAIAGVFVDRWPRRATLVVTNILRAVFVAFLPFASTGSNWLVFALAFLVSCATQFFVPAEAATIPMIVDKRHLITANSLFTTTMMGSVIFGFALGDPLINIFRLEHVHWVISALFVLSAFMLMFVKTPPPSVCVGYECAPTLKAAFAQFGDEMKDGIAYIRQSPMVLSGILKLAILFSTVVAVCILFISLAREFLYADPEVAARKFAYIVATSGIGMAVGGFLVGHQFEHTKRGFMVFGGFIVVGLCLSLLSLVGRIGMGDHVFVIPALVTDFIYLDEVHFTYRMLYTYVLATITGAAAAFVAIPLQALLHELIPDDKRGKVMGVQFTMLSTCSTLPVLAAGLAVEFVGVQTMFMLIGVPLLVFGMLGMCNRLSRMKRRDVPVANW